MEGYEKEIREEKSGSKHVQSKGISTKSLRENPWILSSFVLGAFVLVLVVSSFGGNVTGNVVSGEDVEVNINLILENVFQITDAEISGVKVVDDLYEISIIAQENPFTFHSTLDGEFVRVPNGIWIKMSELHEAISLTENAQAIGDSGFMTPVDTPSEDDSVVVPSEADVVEVVA